MKRGSGGRMWSTSKGNLIGPNQSLLSAAWQLRDVLIERSVKRGKETRYDRNRRRWNNLYCKKQGGPASAGEHKCVKRAVMKRVAKLATLPRVSFRQIQFLFNSDKRGGRFGFSFYSLHFFSSALKAELCIFKAPSLLPRHMKQIHKFGCLKSARSWSPRTSDYDSAVEIRLCVALGTGCVGRIDVSLLLSCPTINI